MNTSQKIDKSPNIHLDVEYTKDDSVHLIQANATIKLFEGLKANVKKSHHKDEWKKSSELIDLTLAEVEALLLHLDSLISEINQALGIDQNSIGIPDIKKNFSGLAIALKKMNENIDNHEKHLNRLSFSLYVNEKENLKKQIEEEKKQVAELTRRFKELAAVGGNDASNMSARMSLEEDFDDSENFTS